MGVRRGGVKYGIPTPTRSSPELKTQAWAKVSQQLQIYLLELYNKCTRS